jgi:dephospho-CoA kinase
MKGGVDVVAMKQRRIGLTGGIASGKSTVGQLLQQGFDLPVLDADHCAREALAPGTAATAAVLARYGQVVRAAGSEPAAATAPAIDRAALGRIVFADPAERQWLEQLIHPEVRRRLGLELERLEAEPVVVLMVPLLFEAGLQELCSEVWLVSCDEARQLERLQRRDGLVGDDARQRLAAQWPLARKRALADVVIANDGDREQLLPVLERLLGRSLADREAVEPPQPDGREPGRTDNDQQGKTD